MTEIGFKSDVNRVFEGVYILTHLSALRWWLSFADNGVKRFTSFSLYFVFAGELVSVQNLTMSA